MGVDTEWIDDEDMVGLIGGLVSVSYEQSKLGTHDTA
jgi:hypothetical protein